MEEKCLEEIKAIKKEIYYNRLINIVAMAIIVGYIEFNSSIIRTSLSDLIELFMPIFSQ